MEKLNRQISALEKTCSQWQSLSDKISDLSILLDMAEEESDEESFREAVSEVGSIQRIIEELELKKLLDEPTDFNNAFLSINSGAGGTEACDWAEMLCRMYTRYAEKSGYKLDLLEITSGEEAGIKSMTLSVQGPYAYGYLKAESGVHRLVRISPFDSNARRHTSFASVFSWPEVDEDREISIKTEEIKVDTYRASGAGGQHINTTDSAVRITHRPTGIVVQCQNQRSQHANKDTALKMLKAALYEKEMEKLRQKKTVCQCTKKSQ